MFSANYVVRTYYTQKLYSFLGMIFYGNITWK